jgi:hypothetical protein
MKWVYLQPVNPVNRQRWLSMSASQYWRLGSLQLKGPKVIPNCKSTTCVMPKDLLAKLFTPQEHG